MRLGICDKDINMRHKMREICDKVLNENDINCCIEEFENGKDVLEYPHEFSVLLTEVDVPGVSGIDMKEWFEDGGRPPYMIFVSDNVERMQDAFGIRVMAFVEKNSMESQLPVAFEKTVAAIERFIKVDGIDSRDIMYIKAEGVYSRIYMENGSTRKLRMSMNQLEKLLLPVFFVRIHRSVLVNLSYVDKLERNAVFIQKQKYPIASRRHSTVREAYKVFCLKI